MTDHRTKSSASIPADEGSSEALAGQLLHRALKGLTQGQENLQAQMAQFSADIVGRLDGQDRVLRGLQGAEVERKHTKEMEQLRQQHRDEQIQQDLEDMERRIGAHSDLVRALPDLRRSVEAHDAFLDSARKAKSAILLSLGEKLIGWALPAVATWAVIHFATLLADKPSVSTQGGAPVVTAPVAPVPPSP